MGAKNGVLVVIASLDILIRKKGIYFNVNLIGTDKLHEAKVAVLTFGNLQLPRFVKRIIQGELHASP